ncbi:DMT family transporter [Tundrisphaera lichenicola]|uniref:DMT family transporter n=1 Tax=Tundrisphaera lichenicola TaxID=2029860 RepID=UPI003EB9462C
MPEQPISDRIDAAGLSAATLCCFLWGGNAVAVKYAISPEGLPPIGGAAIRFLISLPVVLLFCRRAGMVWKVERRYWWLLIAHGFLTAIQIGSFNWGTSHSEAGRSSVFINIHPLVVAPLAWLLLGEHLGWRGIAGLLAAAAGVAVMLARPLMLGGGLMGDLVVLASGVIFGLQAIAQKKTFPIIPPTTLLLAQSTLAIPISFLYSAGFEGFESYHFTTEAIWGLIYQGLFVSGVAFAVWMLLLRRYPAGRLAAVAFLTPLFGISIATFTRGEPFTIPLAVGSTLVGLGIYLVTGEKKRSVESARPAPSMVPEAESARRP